MNKIVFAVTLVTALAPLAVGQDSILAPPVTTRQNTQDASTQSGTEPALKTGSAYQPPFCPPRTCLYYAGDFDFNYSSANGLLNADYDNGNVEGQVWVGIKPDRNVTVTGATFVEFFSPGYVGANPTPFTVQVGIEPGQPGEVVCNTSGNATYSAYGQGQVITYSYTIKKLSRPCKLNKGKVYYVNLLPLSNSGYGYLWNVPPKPLNHHGWKNDLNDCYFESPSNGYNWATCDSLGSFSELSIALTGKR